VRVDAQRERRLVGGPDGQVHRVVSAGQHAVVTEQRHVADGQADHAALGFAWKRPTLLVLGNEREGMSDRVRAECSAIVAIRGTGAVESLNVAVAAGVLIAELTRLER
jgi:tRNA G18 (ribose-2'-O)-methylase SpoU